MSPLPNGLSAPLHRLSVALALATPLSAGSALAGAAPAAQAAVHEPEALDVALGWAATGIEVLGVLIILIGVVAGTLVYVRDGLAAGWEEPFKRYRVNLGRGILLGLELLVAADIIGTVAVTPTFESLGVLALIILIRTFLSFSLEIELEGRLPWRRAEGESGGQAEVR